MGDFLSIWTQGDRNGGGEGSEWGVGPMPDSLVFVYRDTQAAETLAQPYGARGWSTSVVAADDPKAVDLVCAAAPMVIALDAAGDISPALSTACAALERHPDTDPLVVFIDPERDQRESAKQRLPYALFIKSEELPWILKHLTYKG